MARELTIGELSARSGVSQSALRFYEREGLIPARRTDGNQRRYASVTLRRVALLQAGKAAGIPLERIRTALEALPAGKTPTKRDWERLSRSWRRELDERIATLEAIRGRLDVEVVVDEHGRSIAGAVRRRDLAEHELALPERRQLGGGAHYLRRVSPRG